MVATLASLSFLIRSGVTAGGSGPLFPGDALSLGSSETGHGVPRLGAPTRCGTLVRTFLALVPLESWASKVHSCRDSAFDVLRAWLVDRANLDA